MDAYSSDLSNYSNPTSDWDIVSGELHADACNPSNLDTNVALFNFSGWHNGTITLQYRETGGLEGTDCFYYDYYSNSAWQLNNQQVFCNDLGSTLTEIINLDINAMYSDFQLRYRCANFDASGEDLYLDNTNITLFRYGHPNVTTSVGGLEMWIARNTSIAIGADGLLLWLWNTTGQSFGNYSAVSFATKTFFNSGYNYT